MSLLCIYLFSNFKVKKFMSCNKVFVSKTAYSALWAMFVMKKKKKAFLCSQSHR